MLSKPQHGWTEITIGCFVGDGSYIQDIPVLLLEAFTKAIRYNIPAEITIDEEGSEFTIQTLRSTTVTTHRSASETYMFAIDVRTLAAELLADLRRDWQDWLTWPPEHDPALLDRRKQLTFVTQRADHLARLMNSLEISLQQNGGL